MKLTAYPFVVFNTLLNTNLATLKIGAPSRDYAGLMKNRPSDTPSYNSPFSITLPLLNHSYAVQGRIRQRYVLREEDFEPHGPIIIQLTVQEADFTSNDTICRHMAKRLNGKSAVLEHRFFGGSLPTVPRDPEHRVDEFRPIYYQHLTMDNVMNDVRHLAKTLKRSGNQTAVSPVIVVGVGYEGFVAAALRQKYPDEIFAAVSINSPTMGLSLKSDYAFADQFYYRNAVSRLYEAYSPLAVGRIRTALGLLKDHINKGDMAFIQKQLELCEEPLWEPSQLNAIYNHYESMLLDAAVVQTRKGEFRSEWSPSDIAWLTSESVRIRNTERFLLLMGQKTRIIAKMLRKIKEGITRCITFTDLLLSPKYHDDNSIRQLWDPMSYVGCTYYPICTLNSDERSIFGARNDGCKKALQECQVRFNGSTTTLSQRQVWERYDMSPDALNVSSRILFSLDSSDPLSSLVAAQPPDLEDTHCCSSRRIERTVAGQPTILKRVAEDEAVGSPLLPFDFAR
ncbi:peptidase S28 [Ophiocordyceps camponoti-floridani]|uniref:Peptidase S28 n=1 Tax=Ophiocordyceps camponoti-floridani TaxID=2030778 RepID=A0A8H4VBH3_9HYPO|nr:peptidase S28 [Ophiocordyceps camponoti-floridani]